MLRRITGQEETEADYPENAILIAEDLTPSDTAQLDQSRKDRGIGINHAVHPVRLVCERLLHELDKARTDRFVMKLSIDGDKLNYAQTTFLHIYGRDFEHKDASTLLRLQYD